MIGEQYCNLIKIVEQNCDIGIYNPKAEYLEERACIA
jgi:hypothetical protein